MHNRYLMPDDPEYPAIRRLYVQNIPDDVSVLRPKSREVLERWCLENCQGKYAVGLGFIDFELINDYILALLAIENGIVL